MTAHLSEPTVHIVLSAFDAEPFLAEQVASIRNQTHEEWRLWIRDDGSRDGTRSVARQLAEADARIRLVGIDGVNLGASRSFGRLLARLPASVAYVFCSDADDIWMPHKMEMSLEAMRSAEQTGPGPILLHTDLVVTDEALRETHPSYWALMGIDPTRTELRQLLVANVATGPTFLLNRALLNRVRETWAEPIPAAAPHQDWWIALVASAFGRIIALPEASVLYRRHDSNATGRLPSRPRHAGELVRRLLAGPGSARVVRRDLIDAASRQAEAFLDRYGDRVSGEDKAILRELSLLRKVGTVRRKATVLRHFTLPGRGLLRNLGLILRA